MALPQIVLKLEASVLCRFTVVPTLQPISILPYFKIITNALKIDLRALRAFDHEKRRLLGVTAGHDLQLLAGKERKILGPRFDPHDPWPLCTVLNLQTQREICHTSS